MDAGEKSSADYWNTTGLTRGKDKRFEDAIVCFDKAIQLDPDHAKAWYNKALCLKNLRRLSESLACFTEAALLAPNDADSFDKMREVAAMLRNEAHASNVGTSAPPHKLVHILGRWPVGVISTIILLFCVWLAVGRSPHGTEGQINRSDVAKIDDSVPAKVGAQVDPPGKSMPLKKHHKPVSLPNGFVFIRKGAHKGLGKLTVDNGTDQDALVKMVRFDAHKKDYYSFYVRSHCQVEFPGVRPGNYDLVFELGKDWDRKHFRDDRSFSKFDDTHTFAETPSQDEFGRKSIEYSTLRITLNPVPEGKAHTSPMSQEEFDKTE